MDLSGLGRSSGLTRQGVRSDRAVGLITSLAGLGTSSLVLAMLAQPDGLSGTIAPNRRERRGRYAALLRAALVVHRRTRPRP